MAIQHASITDPQIHEPKGASTATADTVYVANGSGSGSWQKVDLDVLDTAGVYGGVESQIAGGGIEVPGRLFLTAVLADVSTASSVIIPIIQDCTVVGASVVLGGAITTADATVSFKNAANADMGTPVTVEFSSSSKGDQYAFTATGNNVLIGPTWIEVATDGGSDTAQPLFITVELEYVLNANV